MTTINIEASEQQPVVEQPPAQEQAATPTAQPSVREWAQANGYEVKATGRLPKAVNDAYENAHVGSSHTV